MQVSHFARFAHNYAVRLSVFVRNARCDKALTGLATRKPLPRAIVNPTRPETFPRTLHCSTLR